jgi:uncharacterized protein (DUF305 family)
MRVHPAILALSVLLGISAPAAALAVLPDDGYMAQSRSVMSTMMGAMDVAPSGDVDRDFVAGMVPHHQGAVGMAQAELRFGRNAALKRIAQEIIITQLDEVVAMRRALR